MFEKSNRYDFRIRCRGRPILCVRRNVPFGMSITYAEMPEGRRCHALDAIDRSAIFRYTAVSKLAPPRIPLGAYHNCVGALYVGCRLNMCGSLIRVFADG